jgi:hypothetical protein
MRDFLEVMEEGAKLESGVSSAAKRIVNFDEKFDKFTNLIANTEGMTAHKRRYLMKEAETTSDFPILFGTVLERSLLAKYQIQKPDWRGYIKTGTQNDFRSNNIIGVFGLQSSLSQVAERGEYKGDKLQDGKVSNSLKKYGRRFDLSWEALINDDLGAFSDLAERLANAALRTEFLNATKLIAASTGPNTALFGTSLTHPIDGSTINNKGTAALDADAIGTVVTAMRNQNDADSEPIMITRFHLVVPPAKEIPALKALSSAALIAVGVGNSAAAQTSENVIAKLPITLHVNPYLPIVDTTHGSTAWYMFADPQSDGPAVQMNFLRGHENPEIVQKLSNKAAVGGGLVNPTEGDFESDSMAWRVRHIMGGTQIDPRFAYAQDASS